MDSNTAKNYCSPWPSKKDVVLRVLSSLPQAAFALRPDAALQSDDRKQKGKDYTKSNILKCAGVSSGANGSRISSMADSRI
jgi:hypothetical protein